MAHDKRLPNYLRAQRKRAGFSQQELAFLLGCRNGAKVSRYERFLREPTLKNALLCEIIFDLPARELFAGAFEQAEKDARRRAHLLRLRLQRRREDPRLDRKLAALEVITRTRTEDLDYWLEPLP
ncbi:MAG TPA: helix-turn-helix transcriptional regulator [Candidatus Binatia bacterium]|nr:helix-turn-helix transcriptional regulator [Candidatus Binatia bacterium]